MLIEIPSTVSDIMTREVVSVDEDDSLQNLLESMRALRFRHLPVTDDNRLIGLITERDLLRASSSDLLPHGAAQSRELFERFRVRDVMVRDVVVTHPETSIIGAAQLLREKRVGCLPVVDANNVLLGILTTSDCVGALAQATPQR
jgi:CBS domain-containing protein